jgi:tetratricopeptide (TPR) repeat protein
MNRKIKKMKGINSNMKWLFVAGLALVSGLATAQKKSETDAALALRSIETAFGSNDIDAAKKATLKAKGFIDQAAVHPETEKSPKTLFLKGEIYAYIFLFRQMNDAVFNEATPSDALAISVKSYNLAFTTSDKYDGDIRESISTAKSMVATKGNALFDAKKYAEAMVEYDNTVQLSTAINEIDTASIYNAGLCAQVSENWLAAAERFKLCASYNYKPDATYLNTATSYIRAGKNDEAMNFLKEAIQKAPKNKYLYWTLGTIAMDINDDALVETNLKKAIELDPNYSDAYFNLGSYFFGKGIDLRKQANDMTDKVKADAALAKSLEYYNIASAPLEKYCELVPKDKDVLKSLWQIFRTLKNTEKEAKYKKLYEEA